MGGIKGAGTTRSMLEEGSEVKSKSNNRITRPFRGVTATLSVASNETLPDENSIKDACVVTILCKQHGYWFPSVLHYLQRTFQWGDAVLTRLQEQCNFEAIFVPAQRSAPATFCHEHIRACGDILGLVYDTVHLRVKIPHSCSGIFEGSVGPPSSGDGTSEEVASLDSFPGSHDETGFGVISRSWRWMTKREAIMTGVVGLEPAKDADTQVLHLGLQKTNVASILLGLEASAPMKDDFFGCQHGASARSKDRSSFGKRKWRDFRRGGIKVPADLGGVQVILTKELFEETVKKCEEMKLRAPHKCSTGADERALFEQILQETSTQAGVLLQQIANSSSVKSGMSKNGR